MARAWLFLSAAAALLAGLVLPAGADQAGPKGVSGLPVPRFVSLKADRVNVHVGPAKTYDVSWVYTRAGLPVEIIAEFETWRRIRDLDGAEGWVYHSLLSGKRTATVAQSPKAKDALLALHKQPDQQSVIVANLQSGVLGAVKQCTSGWCRLSGEGFDGWIEQVRLWGVYPDEKVE